MIKALVPARRVALITCVVVVGCQDSSFDTDITAAFEQAADTTHEEQGAAGTVMLVTDADGHAWSTTRGVADLESARPIDGVTEIRTASAGKTFMGALVLTLHEEGVLDVDDPVSAYVDFVPNGDAVTLRMLLQHTSGIPNYTKIDAYNEAVAADPLHAFSYRELVELSVTEPFDFEPGTGWNYSNTGYVLLGLIVEDLIGRRVEDELEERYFAPLDMRSTHVRSAGDAAELWTGYIAHDGSLAPVPFTAGYPADGSAWVTTLDDLRKWARAFFGGKLHRPETLALAQTTAGGMLLNTVAQAFGFETGGYGLGLVVAHDSDIGPLLAGAGNGDGARTFVGYLPDIGVTFAVAVDVGNGSVPLVETLSASGPIIDTIRTLSIEGRLGS